METEANIADKYYVKPSVKAYEAIVNGVKIPVTENAIYQYRRYYVRENKTNLCPTLTANMGTGGHNVPFIRTERGVRKLTPRECFNLQGFSADYKLPSEISDPGLYKLAGNAISVPVVYQIAKKIVALLSKYQSG